MRQFSEAVVTDKVKLRYTKQFLRELVGKRYRSPASDKRNRQPRTVIGQPRIVAEVCDAASDAILFHAPTDVVTFPALEYLAFSVLLPFGGSGTLKSSPKRSCMISHCLFSSLRHSASISFSSSRLSLL